jgi:hypothetical protein
MSQTLTNAHSLRLKQRQHQPEQVLASYVLSCAGCIPVRDRKLKIIITIIVIINIITIIVIIIIIANFN